MLRKIDFNNDDAVIFMRSLEDISYHCNNLVRYAISCRVSWLNLAPNDVYFDLISEQVEAINKMYGQLKQVIENASVQNSSADNKEKAA